MALISGGALLLLAGSALPADAAAGMRFYSTGGWFMGGMNVPVRKHRATATDGKPRCGDDRASRSRPERHDARSESDSGEQRRGQAVADGRSAEAAAAELQGNRPAGQPHRPGRGFR